VIHGADDRLMSLARFRVAAYTTVLGWYLIAFAVLSGWVFWEDTHPPPGPSPCIECFGNGPIIVIVSTPTLIVLVIGVITGLTAVGQRIDRAEPDTLARSVSIGSAVAGISFLIGLAGLAALGALIYGLAFLQALLR
jgi:hypothetical protein